MATTHQMDAVKFTAELRSALSRLPRATATAWWSSAPRTWIPKFSGSLGMSCRALACGSPRWTFPPTSWRSSPAKHGFKRYRRPLSFIRSRHHGRGCHAATPHGAPRVSADNRTLVSTPTTCRSAYGLTFKVGDRRIGQLTGAEAILRRGGQPDADRGNPSGKESGCHRVLASMMDRVAPMAWAWVGVCQRRRVMIAVGRRWVKGGEPGASAGVDRTRLDDENL